MANGHGGYRPGAGKPKGAKNRATLEREDAEQRYRGHWEQKFQQLMEAQFSTAIGVKQFVYRDDRTGQYKVISDPLELEARVQQGQALEIVTRLASPQAQSDVLDRILGKPKNSPQDLHITSTVNIAERIKERRARSRKT